MAHCRAWVALHRCSHWTRVKTIGLLLSGVERALRRRALQGCVRRLGV